METEIINIISAFPYYLLENEGNLFISHNKNNDKSKLYSQKLLVRYCFTQNTKFKTTSYICDNLNGICCLKCKSM